MVGFEVLLFTRDDEAALPGLDVLQRRQKALGRDHQGIVVPRIEIEAPLPQVAPSGEDQGRGQDGTRQP